MRDSLGWSKYINETLDLFPDAEVAFASHHWPTWGNANIRQFLANQRDTYRFLHDRALNLANQGETMKELGNATFFPKGLAADASSHGYYGTLSHNLRAVYNFYLGFYDANPATLHRLPPVDAAKRYVAAMGGEAAVIAARAQGPRRRRLPLGRRDWSTTRSSPTRTTPRHGAAGRCAGAAGLPGRIGHLAQCLPDGRARAAHRRAEAGASARAAPTRCAA